jgi:hypothetical protein
VDNRFCCTNFARTIGQFAILGDEIIAKNLTKSLNMAAKTLKTREN